MEKNFTTLLVVAAALFDGQGRWLLHCRPESKPHGGLWEFPGGKVEDGEHPRAALVREIEEEAGVILQPDCLQEAGFACGDMTSQTDHGIVILLYTAQEWSGMPEPREGGHFAWFTAAEVEKLEMPPLDVVLARQLFEKSA